MITGIGIGLVVATLMFGWLLIRANQRADEHGKEIIELLRRRTVAAEKMAGIEREDW